MMNGAADLKQHVLDYALRQRYQPKGTVLMSLLSFTTTEPDQPTGSGEIPREERPTETNHTRQT